MILKAFRNAIGKAIVLVDQMTSPTPIKRSEADQAQVDTSTRNLSLYQFENCPFCVKVRRKMKRLALNIRLVDATQDPYQSELLKKGGMLQVPCLRIEKEDGNLEWMYESSDIVRYLEDRFGK